jgi:hypothetical protein
VLLLQPAHPSSPAAEAIVRLRGELLAAGYTVRVADLPETGGVRAALEPAARPAGVDAVVALFGDLPQDPGLLWVIDRASGRTVTRPIPHDVEGARSAQILSVRALELLRASFLEAALPAAAGTPAPKSSPASPGTARTGAAGAAAGAVPPAARAANDVIGTAPRSGDTRNERGFSPPAARAPNDVIGTAPRSGDTRTERGFSPPATVTPREQEAPEPVPGAATAHTAGVEARPPGRVAIEAGGLVLGSLEGMPPAVLPLLRLTLVPVERWPLRARLSVAGLGPAARVNGAEAHAEVSRRLATLEALWPFRLGRRWQPFVSLGAGAAHVAAQGFAAAGGATARTASAWAFVADVGAGLQLGLSRRVYLGGEVHLQGEAPYPTVRYLGNQLAAEGRPTLVAGLSLLVWL